MLGSQLGLCGMCIYIYIYVYMQNNQAIFERHRL